MTTDQLSTKMPKSGRFRPRDWGSYVFQSVRSIIRNKRRSTSMIAGLVLGISILAGILLYSNVLMTNVYTSIIEGSPYEIRMDFKEDVSDSQIQKYRKEFKDNDLISEAQFLYGDGRTVVEGSDFSEVIYTLAYLTAEIQVEYDNKNHSGAQGRIFSQSFYDSEIGINVREQLITGKNPEIYTQSNPNYLGVLISESLSVSAKLQQGNKLKRITLEIMVEDPTAPNFPFNEKEIAGSVTLTNITIAGIMSSESEASAGLFSEAIVEGMGSVGGEMYLPEELFDDVNHGGDQTSFLALLRQQEMRYCALKIDENRKEFNFANPSGVSGQINSIINGYHISYPDDLVGTNLVQGKLMPFQIMSIFIYFFDGMLTIPVAILSLYLLSFGIDLSLHERRYQIGILKTQGASPSQIKRKIMMEALLLAALGLFVGYIVAVLGAWIIGSATGFMKWGESSLPLSDTALSQLPEFLRLMPIIGEIDQTAFFVVGGLIVIILISMVNGKSNSFIRMEITETVRRTGEGEKENFLKRNNLDIIFFVIGFVTLVLIILVESGISIDLGPATIILALLGPFLFWIGGAAVIARIAVWIPSKTDPIVKRIGFLKDVSILIKGNIFRKSGDIPRLALIIALTVSFGILAAVQGGTGEFHQMRLIEFDVGSDMVISTTNSLSTTTVAAINNISPDIENVMAMTSTTGTLGTIPIIIHSVDAEVYGTVGKWQSDAFSESGNKEEILESLVNNPKTGCLVGKSIFSQNNLKENQNINISILAYYSNGTMPDFDNGGVPAFGDISLEKLGIQQGILSQELTILGVFDHTPSGIGSNAIIVDHTLINSMTNMSFLSGQDPKGVLSSKFLVKVNKGADIDAIKGKFMSPDNDWVTSVKTFEEEMRKSTELQQMDYGIPGLLTADFVISVLAATLATFIFMSILMEKRKKEFAILRSYGASQGQIYKVVFSETIVLLLTSVVWGLFIGLGLSIMFTGFFDFINIFITPMSALTSGGSQIKRLLIFNWVDLLMTISITFLAMLFATFISVRSVSKAKISTVIREL